MAIHRKVFRFRMRPTKTQESSLNRLAGARRFIWNWGLRRWKDYYEANGKSIGIKQLSAELTALKQQPETVWLKEANAQSLQQTLKDLHRAFTNYFGQRARHPRFKSRKRDLIRFRIPQQVKIEGSQVIIPKVGKVRIFKSMDVDLPTKSASFKRDALGRWFVTLTAEFEMPDVALPEVDQSKVVGIDLGLIDFAVTSDGVRVPAPNFYRKSQRKLRQAQRVVSRRQPGSNRKAKARLVVAKVHQKIANQRGDFLHKLSTDLISGYDGICIEDLSVNGLARTKLAKSVTDASWGEFRRQLTYKATWNRKHLIVIDRFFPSSRLCRGCGAVNDRLALSDREWDCDCGMVHDRDRSAAINIRDEGLRILAVGHTDKQNARGIRVRPTKVGSGC
ncbi:MAG: RNA-guided endonuclease TnpB family protein [Phycisphaerales bacterium]